MVLVSESSSYSATYCIFALLLQLFPFRNPDPASSSGNLTPLSPRCVVLFVSRDEFEQDGFLSSRIDMYVYGRTRYDRCFVQLIFMYKRNLYICHSVFNQHTTGGAGLWELWSHTINRDQIYRHNIPFSETFSRRGYLLRFFHDITIECSYNLWQRDRCERGAISYSSSSTAVVKSQTNFPPVCCCDISKQ